MAAFSHLLTAADWRFAPGWSPDPIAIREIGRGSTLQSSIDGESRGTLEVPITAAGYGQLTPGKVVTVVWMDGTWEEYRLVEVTDTGAGTGVGTFALAGYASILADAGLVREDTADGARRYVFDRPALTATEQLTSTVLDLLADAGISYVALGSVTVTGRRDISYRADHGLAALQAIATAWSAEYEIRADVGASLYRIDLVPQRNAGVFGSDLRLGHNAALTRTRSRVEQVNAVVPLLADGSTIAEARWRVSALTGTTLTLADPNGGDGPIREDEQLTGLWVEAADLVTRVQITATSAALQRVTVASTAGFAAESRVRIVRTNTGAWLTELTSPSAIAASGRKGGVLPLPDLAGINNLIVNPVMSSYTSPSAAPDGWSVMGAVTLTRTATVGFTALGGFSARVQTTADGQGLASPAAPLPVSALRPFVSGAVSLRVETGEVRVELVATDGVTTWVFPDGAQKAVPAQKGLLTTMVLSGWDLDTLGATSAWLRVVQEGAAAADYYVDAAQLVVSNVPISQISEGYDATRAWQRGNLHLDLYAPVRVRYDARVADLARLDGTAFPDHALVLGGTHRAIDPVLGVADGLRVVQITRRVLVEAETTVALSNRPEDLISLQSRRDPVARVAGNNPVVVVDRDDGAADPPSISVQVTPGTTSYSIAYTAVGVVESSLNGGAWVTAEDSPIAVPRNPDGGDNNTLALRATSAGQTVTSGVIVVPPQDPAPPAGGTIVSFSAGSPDNAANTIPLSFALDDPPAGFTLDLSWFRNGSDGGTTNAVITGIGTTSPYTFAADTDLAPKGTPGREDVLYRFTLALRASGGTTLSTRSANITVNAVVPPP